MRLYGFRATGALPDVLSFGGLDTLRNIDIYGISGNTAAFANLEFRFPLIDLLATPILGLREIRGKVFFDIGGAAYKNQDFTFYQDGQLVNGIADYGFGISLNFLGLPLHFDFSRLWNFKQLVRRASRPSSTSGPSSKTRPPVSLTIRAPCRLENP